jgi:hypothetical protein
MAQMWQDFLTNNGFEKLEEATKLSDEDDDPETDPYSRFTTTFAISTYHH